MAKRFSHEPRLRRGDTVVVVTGADRGSQGRVLRILPGREQVVIEGVNLVYRHIRRSQQNPQGGRVRRESPIHISNVMFMDTEAGVPTKLGRKLADPEKGSLGWTRTSRRTGADVDAADAKPAKKGRKSKSKE